MAFQNDEITIEKLTFYVDAPTAKDYSDFIVKLRKILTGSRLDKYNVRTLRSESEAQGKLYCYVDVSYDNKPLTIAFDVVNLNLVAFQFNTSSYFFLNTKDNDIFHGTVKVVMPFMNTYASLGNRAAVKLGKCALQNAVSVLTSFNQHEESAIKTSIINVMGMVLEATKLKLVQNDVTKDFDNDFLINIQEISYEDNWAILSEYIQVADSEGNFPHPVFLKNLDGSTRRVTNVADVIADMGILKYYSRFNVITSEKTLSRFTTEISVGDALICVVIVTIYRRIKDQKM